MTLLPWYYTTDELIAYCEQHADPVIRESAKLFALPQDLEKEYKDEIWELQSNLTYAEQEQASAEERAQYSDNKYNALMLDNDQKYAIKEIFRLKSEVLSEITENRELKLEIERHLGRISDLENQLDMWNILKN
jgi:hypothetical protein